MTLKVSTEKQGGIMKTIKRLSKYQTVYIYLGLFFVLIPYSFGQQRYNVIKDNGFENNDSVWVVCRSYPELVVNRHYQDGYESKYCGLTETNVTTGQPVGFVDYCYLGQKLAKRIVKDYDLGNNIKYFLGVSPSNQPGSWDCWCLTIGNQKNRLLFLCSGTHAGKIPHEDESTYVVLVGVPKIYPWEAETLNFYENWIKKFSETDMIEYVRLYSYGYEGISGILGQKVQWDDIVFESTRPDSDAVVVDIGFSGSPSAKVENKGAVVVSFPTICDIFKGSNKVYTDTVNVNSLAVDSIKQVSFKPYSDTGEMKIYTTLPGDQNPSNDTLTKNLGVQEVAVKKPLEFRVWPTLTKGIINVSSPNPIAIYNIEGRGVAYGDRGIKKFNLPSAGVYFVKSDGEIKKIIKID